MDETPTPARLWFGVLRRLGRVVTGRRLTMQGVTFTVASLHGRPDGSTWSFARAHDVQVVLDDVTGPDLDARELVVECDTLTVGSTLAATGITLTAVMSPESVLALGDHDGPHPAMDIVDGELRSRWLPGIDVVIRPEVAPDRLRFVTVAVITPAGRWSPPRWWPAGTAPPPELPGGLRLADIAIAEDAVVLRATIDHWSLPPEERPRLRELLGADVRQPIPG